MSGYLLPYNTSRDDLWDDGDDPCFSDTPYSWGICRPQVRKWVKQGQYLFFVAHDKRRTGKFFLKGYFRVARKMTMVEVLDSEAFRSRRNVVIERISSSGPAPAALRAYLAAHGGSPRWSRTLRSTMSISPEDLGALDPSQAGLAMFEEAGARFVHRYDDEHALDDWRCSRLFLCEHQYRKDCLNGPLSGTCPNRMRLPLSERSYYVVGDDVDCGRIDTRAGWDEVVRTLGPEFDDALRRCFTCRDRGTRPYEKISGQKNVTKLGAADVEALRRMVLTRASAAR